jgi:hypothetical protein
MSTLRMTPVNIIHHVKRHENAANMYRRTWPCSQSFPHVTRMGMVIPLSARDIPISSRGSPMSISDTDVVPADF